MDNITKNCLLRQNYSIRFRDGLPVNLLYLLYMKSFPKTRGDTLWDIVAVRETENPLQVGGKRKVYATDGAIFLGLILMLGASTRAMIAIPPRILV